MQYLWGYVSALQALAHIALEFDIQAPQQIAVITNAEPLEPHQRDVIGKAFRCPVYETYGQCEKVAAASECIRGRLHAWPEVGYLEILRDADDTPANAGEVGRLISTGLLDSPMPLIRYDTGDRASVAPSDTPCPCGRSLPIITSIEGRADDAILIEVMIDRKSTRLNSSH